MKIWTLWRCRACGEVFRNKVPAEFDAPPPSLGFALSELKGRGTDAGFVVHDCSAKIAGVCQFAGVESDRG